MRTCSYCGKEHRDDAVQCSIDGAILTENVLPVTVPPPFISHTAQPFTPSERQLRLIEVVMVCTIALGGSLLVSVLSLFQTSMQSLGGTPRWSYALLGEVTSLVLLWYVLLRRSKSFSDLGFVWRWTDIGWSVLLCVGGYIAYCVTYYAVYYGAYYTGLPIGRSATNSSVGDHFFGGGVEVITIVFLCINPFFEELIARAYLMTEVKCLAKSAITAVLVSTMFQMTYHLYQGVPLAMAAGGNFLLWSLFYARTNRITPVILAHLYFDLGSTLVYVARH